MLMGKVDDGLVTNAKSWAVDVPNMGHGDAPEVEGVPVPSLGRPWSWPQLVLRK